MINKITSSRPWKSFFRHGYPDNEQDRSLVIFSNVFLHVHPVKVREDGLRFTYTFCLGGISFFLFISLVISGMMLMFYYIPFTEQAYSNMLSLKSEISLGMLMRNA